MLQNHKFTCKNKKLKGYPLIVHTEIYLKYRIA